MCDSTAPATYWRERATIASKKANWALAAFMGGGVAVVGLSIVFGPELLERLAAVEGAGSFAPLALVSIPALTALWGLRHVARLFVANLEGGADARMRETMATTFLALTKEQGNIEKEERLLVLEAFVPPAACGSNGRRLPRRRPRNSDPSQPVGIASSRPGRLRVERYPLGQINFP